MPYQKQQFKRDHMDIIYIGALGAFFALSCVFAAGCDRLGGK